MKTVSLCMIVKNEESNLGRCLASIKNHVDEIIIVDTGSTDRTKEIAREHGAIVYEHPWNNSFSEARNVSLRYATKDLILIMDGDDEFHSEDLKAFDLLKEKVTEKEMLIYFDTLNYGGDQPSLLNITINPNPRLFSNHAGFCYEGTVHNQLVNHEREVKHIYETIRIFHYGYLNSYQSFDPNIAYSFYLIMRLIMLYYNKQEYQTSIQYAKEGLKYYPDSTDINYYYGLANGAIGRVTIAERALKRCLEIGDHGRDKFLYGTGSFRAAFELGALYERMRDYEEAFHFYNKALSLMPSFIEAAYAMFHVLSLRKCSDEEFVVLLKHIFSNLKDYELHMSSICYKEHRYQLADEFLNEHEKKNESSETTKRLRLSIGFMLGKYEEVFVLWNQIKKDSTRWETATIYMVSCVVTNRVVDAYKMIASMKEKDKAHEYEKQWMVYEQLIAILEGKEPHVLSEDKENVEFTAPIFELLELLLATKQLKIFYQALALCNLISDESVLIRLGKLYHKYENYDMARHELIHSIRHFSLYDLESLLMLMVL